VRAAAIALEDFRSYEERKIDLAPGVTAFVGPNGAGKTNILEAVHLISRSPPGNGRCRPSRRVESSARRCLP